MQTQLRRWRGAPEIRCPRRFEQTAEASAARKLKMTEALAKRVRKKREDRLALWADDGEHDDDDEECASNKLAVVLEEVKGRGADFRHLREVRLVDCLITDAKLEVLVAALGQGCVSVLALGGNQISNIGARTLGEALAALAPLRELHLNGNNIADPGVEFLCKGLFGHATAAEKKEQLRKAKRLQRMASAKAKRLNVKGKSNSLTPPPKPKQQPRRRRSSCAKRSGCSAWPRPRPNG